MRSYYPDFVVSRRKSAASAHLVEPRGILEEDLPPNLSEVDFQDVELFLTEYGNEADAAAPEEAYEEHEIADILAVS